MKNKRNKIIIFIITLLYMFFCSTTVEADVGSFESYSGSSSSSSSSWGSGSSSSSYDSWDSGSSKSRTRIRSNSKEDDFFLLLIIVIAICIGIRKMIMQTRRQTYKTRINENIQPMSMFNYEQKEIEIEEKLKQIDPLFSKEQFIASSKNLFIKLQQAWTDRDWSVIRVFETNELFEQHKNQLQGYIDNNQINVMDRICVNYAHLFNFKQEGDKDILTIRLNSRMADYIIDATSGKILKGDKNTEYVNTYLLTFIRKHGLLTKEDTNKINTTNCPNCGAPTQITSAGKCEYCGSVITTGEYNWVLSNLEREK